MNVIDTRSNLIGIAVGLEGIQKFHVALRGFNGDDVGVQALDRWENIVEIRVAKVRMRLKVIRDTGGRELE